MCGTDCLLALIAIVFPPLAVWVKRGICSADTLINIALCILGFLPGLIHAWYIIFSNPDPDYEQVAQQDPERGQSRVYIIQHGQPRYAPQQQQGGSTNYGTVNNSAPSAQFPQPKQSGFVQPQGQASSSSEPAPPPTYQQAVQSDNKIQRS